MRVSGLLVVCARTLILLLVCQAPIGASARATELPIGPWRSPAYSFTTVDPPGSVSTFLFAINSRGDIVGQSTDAEGVAQSFVMSGGAIRVISFPGAAATRARGINGRREIVGVYRGGHGFLLRRGRFTTIDFPGATRTAPRGINEAGDIVGDFSGPDGVVHGFLLRHGRYRQIDFPGACGTLPNAINDAGVIVGNYGLGVCDGTEENHGFRLRKGVYTTEDDPNGIYPYVTVPYGINARGHVVGTYSGSDATHGFLSRRGRYVDIDFPGAAGVTRCFGINHRGWIVGDYFDAAGVRHGFLATR
jgi:uncharacterized membrane protein